MRRKAAAVPASKAEIGKDAINHDDRVTRTARRLDNLEVNRD